MQDSSFSQDTSFFHDTFQRFKLWVWVLVHFNYWGLGNNTWSFEILLGKDEDFEMPRFSRGRDIGVYKR